MTGWWDLSCCVVDLSIFFFLGRSDGFLAFGFCERLERIKVTTITISPVRGLSLFWIRFFGALFVVWCVERVQRTVFGEHTRRG
jgi:hypothetical protein